MSSRDEMQRILDAEMRRWAAKPVETLITELSAGCSYEIKTESGTYRAEILRLENTAEYPHVSVSIDDGRPLSSLLPLTSSFICRKQ